MPGDFAGGLINVTTTENFSDFTQLTFNVGYRNNTTFGDYYQTEGSKTDFLGYDNGYRQLPSGFPTDNGVLNNDAQSIFYAHQLPNNFEPIKGTASLDSGIGFSIGRKINFKNGKTLSTVNMISYGNKFENYNKTTNTYINNLTGAVSTAQLQRDFDDQFYSNEVRMTLLSNWSLRFNDKNKITFKNLYNQIGENFSTLRSGFDFDQRPGQLLNNFELGYSGRRILTSQFNGQHQLKQNNDLTWFIGVNYINDILPDLKRFRTFRDINNPQGSFKIIAPPSSNPFDTGRFYSELNEYSTNGGVDYKLEIERVKNDEELANIVIKTGIFADYKNRDFSARYFSYLIPGYFGLSQERENELLTAPLSNIFSPTNVNVGNGWVLREGTNKSDSYKATNLLTAGYLYAEFPISKFLLTGGVRLEHNNLTVDGFRGIELNTTKQSVTSILPSFNFSYNVNEKNVIRLAYSRTLNRPEFREIAPFNFYNFQEDTEIEGNPSLITANLDNLDFRYEFYPNKGEIASLGLFYKKITNPIENFLPVKTNQRAMSFVNSESAILYGAELEIRKSFKEIFKVGFLSNLAINVNASYIFSEVELGQASTTLFDKRALQGQSPYVINVALGYDNKDNGWSSNIIYNRYGDRIYALGNQIFPTIFELARNQLDFSISKSLKKMTFKLGVSNILDDKFRFFQDRNSNFKINTDSEQLPGSNTINYKEDDPIFVHQTGALYNFIVTYKF
jgi:Outer membrane protein beta-barrel family